MILLRTHLHLALEWLSIRIQLPKDDPLRVTFFDLLFFSNEYFALFVYTIFFED